MSLLYNGEIDVMFNLSNEMIMASGYTRSIELVKNSLFSGLNHYYISKNSQFENQVIMGLLQLHASGLLPIIEYKKFRMLMNHVGKVKQYKEPPILPQTLTLDQTQSMFYILMVCLAISTTVFIFEMIYSRPNTNDRTIIVR